MVKTAWNLIIQEHKEKLTKALLDDLCAKYTQGIHKQWLSPTRVNH